MKEDWSTAIHTLSIRICRSRLPQTYPMRRMHGVSAFASEADRASPHTVSEGIESARGVQMAVSHSDCGQMRRIAVGDRIIGVVLAVHLSSWHAA